MKTKILLDNVEAILERLISSIHQHHATTLDPSTKYLFEEGKQALVVLDQVRTKLDEIRFSSPIIDFLERQYAYEKERLRMYGDGCTMGKCAMSRIHLMDEIFKLL